MEVSGTTNFKYLTFFLNLQFCIVLFSCDYYHRIKIQDFFYIMFAEKDFFHKIKKNIHCIDLNCNDHCININSFWHVLQLQKKVEIHGNTV